LYKTQTNYCKNKLQSSTDPIKESNILIGVATIRLLKFFAILILSLAISTVFLLVAMHQITPMQTNNTSINSTTALLAKNVAARNLRLLKRQQQETQLSISQQELDSLINIFERANPAAAIQANISQQGMYVELSYQSLFESFINVSVLVIPSSTQLELGYVRVGYVEFPVQLSLVLLEKLLAQVSDLALLDNINRVSFDSKKLFVNYTMSSDPKSFIHALTSLATRFGSKHNVDNDLGLTEQYYQQLVQLQRQTRGKKEQQPLAYFIKSLLRTAHHNTAQGSDPVAENRAAIFALAVYFGSYRFEYFIGKLSKPQRKNRRDYYLPRLAKRHDLTQHFIYSAAIELLSSKDTSEFVGELKELLDSNKSGSGFSFIDLMADRAGVKFAQNATQDETSARGLQQVMLAQFDDHDLLPQSTKLPEHLSKAQFEQAYQHIKAPAYQALISDIDQRLNTLNVYQNN